MIGIGGMRKPSGCGDPSCFVALATGLDVIGHVSQCDSTYVKLGQNRYYSPDGNASLGCGSELLTIPEVQKKFGVELGSSSAVLPSDIEIVKWAKERLGMPNVAL